MNTNDPDQTTLHMTSTIVEITEAVKTYTKTHIRLRYASVSLQLLDPGRMSPGANVLPRAVVLEVGLEFNYPILTDLGKHSQEVAADYFNRNTSFFKMSGSCITFPARAERLSEAVTKAIETYKAIYDPIERDTDARKVSIAAEVERYRLALDS